MTGMMAAGGADANTPQARRVWASWERSQGYGVAPDSVEPSFTGTNHPESLFARCGTEVLSDLQQTLLDEPVSLMLTDADGVVLHRSSGDRALLSALDVVHLAPGFAYSERDVGTNGLGMALADRAPAMVRADQHYARGLDSFTCAAVPVLDPVTGVAEGCVNLTTWTHTSGDLLLALARSAASNTAALMSARTTGAALRATPRGHVVRVQTASVEPGAGTLGELSGVWLDAVRRAADAMSAGRIVAVVGEPGSGRATLLAQAARRARPRDRILSAAPPDPADLQTWLDLWTPEVGKDHTAVIVRDVDRLPLSVAEDLRSVASRRRAGTVPIALTATDLATMPTAVIRLIDTVIEIPPLRDRASDVLPLAAHIARRARGRDVAVSRTAQRVLENYSWPGNVAELTRTIIRAAYRTDTIDLAHLPPVMLAGGSRNLSRIEAFERDEIIRVLTTGAPNTPTMSVAAHELGMSRATLYRKVAQYGIVVTR